MQTVMAKTNEVCMRYLDNSKLCTLPTPGPPYNEVSTCAIKNTRRRMEDRHVVIHDLNSLFFDQVGLMTDRKSISMLASNSELF